MFLNQGVTTLTKTTQLFTMMMSYSYHAPDYRHLERSSKDETPYLRNAYRAWVTQDVLRNSTEALTTAILFFRECQDLPGCLFVGILLSPQLRSLSNE